DHLRIYLVNDNLSLHWTPQIRAWAEVHNVELVATPTSASHLNRIECHFRPLREFVVNASDYVSHADVAVAFRRYLHRRNTDDHVAPASGAGPWRGCQGPGDRPGVVRAAGVREVLRRSRW